MCFILQSVHLHAHSGAPKLNTGSRACSIVRNAAPNVVVFLRAPMATRRSVPATMTGKPKEGGQSALRYLYVIFMDIRIMK